MIEIKLNFINNSNDANNSEVVIFQQNASPSLTSDGQMTAVAWNVITSTPGKNNVIAFPVNLTVAASDSFGNVTPQLPAANGQRFDMTSTPVGNQLHLNSQGTPNKSEVEIHNELPVGEISAMIYRNGLLLATKTGIGPGLKAVFQFYPVISIVVTPKVVQGDIINSSIISDTNVIISLLGISSADIVMTGGGSGSSSTPYIFTLQNIVYS